MSGGGKKRPWSERDLAYGERFHLTLTQGQREKLSYLASAFDRSKSAVMRELIEAAFQGLQEAERAAKKRMH